MKISKKTLIITLSAVAVIATGGLSFAAFKESPKPVSEVKPVASVTKEATQPTEPVAEPVQQPQTTQTIESTAPVTPAPTAPVVPSFDELITKYPSMSADAIQTACAKKIEATYPERFQDHNRVFNVDLIGKTFVSMCGLTRNYTDIRNQSVELKDMGSGDFWVRFGGQ